MNFLLLNQTFQPDVASTAQHLSELAADLAERGHQVTVVTSRRAYDDPKKLFPKNEIWRGVRIIRIGSTGFGKSAKWKRAADFASFSFLCALRLGFLPRPDCVVALTSPPLISFLGAVFAKWRGSKFVYWVMDFNPDEAIAAGWLRENSFAAKILDGMSRFSLRRAKKIIALDRFMRERIVAKGIPVEKIFVLPPWSHDGQVRFDPAARDDFRKAHGLDGTFVVMYSGNHSPCHPLDTLLKAAEKFSDDGAVTFCFIGGGSEFKKVKAWSQIRTSKPETRNPRVLCLPYQPLGRLAGSLSAADLHVVVMGDAFTGLIHPCKIYNILKIASPVLYIGPPTSHISEIATAVDGSLPFISARHNDVENVVAAIQNSRNSSHSISRSIPASVLSSFSKQTLLPKLIAELESA